MIIRSAICLILLGASGHGLLRLPDTSEIDGQLTANLHVDHFFSLWLVFNNDDVQMSHEPFTILAPQNSATKRTENLLQQPELVKKLLLDHIILGARFNLTPTAKETDSAEFRALSGRKVVLTRNNSTLFANNAKIIAEKLIGTNGLLLVLDDFLAESKEVEKVGSDKEQRGNFVENVLEVLSFLKSGVRVFQHFLSRSNVSKLLLEGEDYTVFVPTDHAFQRWHPIDWGFYPFSVPEFTESVIINHFVRGRLRQETLNDHQVVRTLGGREIVFKRSPNLQINGASIVKGDTPVERGNIMFIGEVLFVSESVVSKLHQQHRDKETPPLLAFPWFGAQFLSHAFLALERDKRFTQVTRFLNLADLAPHVSGTGYTFFVPVDSAFERLGLDKMPDNYLSTGDGLEILLNHFVKGRLYDKDLMDGSELVTLGNKTITIKRTKEKVEINDATIVESEVFVYNLGTMFYTDRILFTTPNSLPATSTTEETVTASFTTAENSEQVPEELTEDGDSLPDVLFADGAAPTTDSDGTTLPTIK